MKKILLVVLVSVAFQGCKGSDSDKNNGGDAAVTAEGNCNDATINAFNDLILKAKLYDATKSLSTLNDVLSSCGTIKSLLGNRSCTALDQMTGEVKTVSYSLVKSGCDKAQALAK